MRDAYIFDIDGTLADCEHRLKYLPNWDKFFQQMVFDTPHRDTIDVMGALYDAGYDIICVSGRPEKYRPTTEAWLNENDADYYHELIMRPDGDFCSDVEFKQRVLTQLQTRYDIKGVFDDRPSVIKMWRDNGLICYQVNDRWNEKKKYEPGLLTLIVGPSRAGKTTWLASDPQRFAFDIWPWQVVSSDDTRHAVTGDQKDHSQEERVWSCVHALLRARIEVGAPAVLDATNLKRKHRLAAIKNSDAEKVRYIILDRPLEEKLKNAGDRGEKVVRDYDQKFKSALKDILKGDGLPNVEVIDLRQNT